MKLKGWRTVVFSIAVMLTGLAELTDAVNLIAPQYTGALLVAIGIGSLVLRLMTDTRIGVDPNEDNKDL